MAACFSGVPGGIPGSGKAGQRLPPGCLQTSVESQRLSFVHPQPGALHFPRPNRAEPSQNSHGSQAAERIAYCSLVTVGQPAAHQPRA